MNCSFNLSAYAAVLIAKSCRLKMLCFWNQYPALLYGLAVLVGAALALSPRMFFFIPCLFFLFVNKPRMLLSLLCAFTSWWYTTCYVELPDPSGKARGDAVFEIIDKKQDVLYGKAIMRYKIKVFIFSTRDCVWKNFPCAVQMSNEKDALEGGKLYRCQALLWQQQGQQYLRLLSPCKKVGTTLSFVEWRYQAKREFSRLLASLMPAGKARSFLQACLSGSGIDMISSDALRACGLQHLIVISGFHFSMLAICLLTIFGTILPWRLNYVSTFICVSGYLVFIGLTPSVLRAYIAVSLYCLAPLFSKRASGINSLGVALSVVVLLDPVSTCTLSFQLSFLATWAILILYPIISQAIRQCITKFSISQLVFQNVIDQWAYILRNYFIESASAILAVQLMTAPLLLYVFHVLPIGAFVFNCFIPFFLALGMWAVVLTSIFWPFPSVSKKIFSILHSYFDRLLDFAVYAPTFLQKMFYGDFVSEAVVLCSIVMLSFIGMLFHARQERALLCCCV